MSSISVKPQTNPARGVPKAEQSLAAALPDSTVLKWLRDMYLIREFENRTAQAYQQAKIGGFCHLYIGQEACGRRHASNSIESG